MFARAQSGYAHPGVLVDGCVDMHRVDLGIFQQFIVVGIAFLNTEGITDRVEFVFAALADRGHVRVGVALVDRNEFRAEA